MKNEFTEFKNWLRNIWLDNCEEHNAYGELPYTMQEYWHKYKWWLRREYRFQRLRDNHDRVTR